MKQPTPLEIELVEIDKIIPHEANERLHPDKNIEMLRKGLDDFDQQKPIVVDDNYKIIAGHGVWFAAKKAEYTHWYVAKSKLKGNKKKAYRIFDNSSGETSKWNDEALSKSLKELYDDSYCVADLGFDDQNFEFKDFTERNESEKKLILNVIFENETEQQELFLELRDRGYKIKI